MFGNEDKTPIEIDVWDEYPPEYDRTREDKIQEEYYASLTVEDWQAMETEFEAAFDREFGPAKD
jgi:hypothetical protein